MLRKMPTVRLVTYPRADFAFEAVALSVMRDGAGTPAELEAGLSVDYPLVRVVAGINEGGVDRWYAYRDGSVLPSL